MAVTNEPASRGRSVRVALGVGSGYLAVALCWIVFSDQFVELLTTGKGELATYQTYKGLAFVAVMAGLIGIGAYVAERRREQVVRHLRSLQTDALTGLPALSVAEQRIDRQVRAGAAFGVLVFDVRNFGRFNQGLGRGAGDALLREIAERLSACAKQEELAVRMEGDKFLVVLPAGTEEGPAVGRGADICAVLRGAVATLGTDIAMDLCVGLAMVPRDAETVSGVLDACEAALYRAKVQKAMWATAASGAESAHARSLLHLEADLRRAIRDRQFQIVLQPQLSLRSFRVIGAEALVRWHHPERGVVGPGEFIWLAESLGLITDITEQVLELGVEQWQRWPQASRMRLGVNLSGVDLGSERIVEALTEVLGRFGLPGEQLTLEITESWLAQEPECAFRLLERMRGLGTHIAVDDFGSGYSSLAQLSRFAVDCIKIDRGFVTAAHDCPRRSAVLEAVRHLATALGTRTLAEGVETFDELLLLKRLGFDQAQGYLFGRPVPPAEFEARYLRNGLVPDFQVLRERAEVALADSRAPLASKGGWASRLSLDLPATPVPIRSRRPLRLRKRK